MSATRNLDSYDRIQLITKLGLLFLPLLWRWPKQPPSDHKVSVSNLEIDPSH